MNRAIFLLALAFPLAPRVPKIETAKIEIVGPSVLMNRAREGKIQIFDLRPNGRRVPGATKKLDAPLQNVSIFAIGEAQNAQKWAQRRDVKSFSVVLPHMIEFEVMHGAPQIEPRVAWEKTQNADWPMFDLSEAFEFNSQRLPLSHRLDFGDFKRGDLAQLPKDRPFIVACRVGHRSQLVTKKLRSQGYDARNLNGGLWEWQCQNLPLAGDAQ
ncbi:MAG TPA: rhodanese-like domain-containing protein [Abditibacterium sp.]|jgi:rhodanese-related sulfurtransferase